MIDSIYIEAAVREHARTQSVLKRFPQARIIECERYGEVFNPKAQNFRLQKQQPALILAQKHQKHVLPTPSTYGLGAQHNFYFSHMLNCLYDCRYCFLQGMYTSAHYVLFVNYEDFGQSIDAEIARHPHMPCWFFSGYDCDSLALEPISGFLDYCLDFFSQRPTAFLELRTKSTQIRKLLARPALDNVVVAFSFTPERTAKTLEHKAPSIQKRIAAMQALAARGWQVGIRLDPMFDNDTFETDYAELIEALFSGLEKSQLHSVSLGTFRLPQNYFKTISRLYPDEPLYACNWQAHDGMLGYPQQREQQLMNYCQAQLQQHIGNEKIHACISYA